MFFRNGSMRAHTHTHNTMNKKQKVLLKVIGDSEEFEVQSTPGGNVHKIVHTDTRIQYTYHPRHGGKRGRRPYDLGRFIAQNSRNPKQIKAIHTMIRSM